MMESSETKPDLGSEQIFFRVQKLKQSPSVGMNCASFVMAVMSGGKEIPVEYVGEAIREFIGNYEIIGVQSGYDLELAKRARMLAIGFLNETNRFSSFHYAVISPKDPNYIFHRPGYESPITKCLGNEAAAAYTSEDYGGEFPVVAFFR